MIAAAFSVVCVITLKLLFVKGLKYKPSYDELICLGIFTLFSGWASRMRWGKRHGGWSQRC